ncbi:MULTISPECIES: AzlC family ABC transporter permease [unclassified Oceanispirochaeta]|uniref:AzlC family ABC transporter permease n=1 Tax=unclassified Oceanispirochaeta TaxID=2635722 RepID=UPI000E092CBF|nr:MULTISPECIES: AzlC family ABC transporter permease [unclassified Oceanispirochaeta]MBF9018232.1 AzlC family ABC transporter permease [Oceanispirochaeta sp. M2]NPD74662.1 AzlC family ABC transporter permease [Oceanispirochaeta sp. M1]RDG29491.1 branched-chain amino acid ABC transporter permease [Oceanispirochaeta sp. M1]
MGNQKYSKTSEFTAGARAALPLLMGTAPFGLIYGTLAVTAGLSNAAAVAMSLFVFAGSAQFIAVGLVGAGAPVAIIILTTVVVNLRHMLYSATLLPYLKTVPQRWRIALAFWLTDEAFAVCISRYREDDDSPWKHWYQLGASLAMYVNWQIWCILGLILGSRISDAGAWGLDFALPVTFIGMTIPFIKNRSTVVCVITAAAVSLMTGFMPFKLGLIVAALAGVSAGLLVDKSVQYQEFLKGEQT